MAGFFQSLLHLLALIVLVRLLLPARYAVLNPYAAAADTLLNRILGFLRGGIPLPPKGLCLILLGLSLALRAALSYKQGDATVSMSLFATAVFAPKTFLGWLWLEVIEFTGYYLNLLSAVFFLRLWHRSRALPGYTGNLLELGTHPFSRLNGWMLAGAVAALACVFVSMIVGTVPSPIHYTISDIQNFREAFEALKVSNPFDLSSLPMPLRLITLAGLTVIDTLGQLQHFLFMLLLLALFAMLFGSPSLRMFLADMFKLLQGPLPNLRIGPIDLSPLLTFFVLGALRSLLIVVFLLLIRGLIHVV